MTPVCQRFWPPTFTTTIFAVLLACIIRPALAGPITYLEDRFELPSGFRIYRAAGAELTGGSYALTFDGEGRLLVGDGKAIRRLIDRDNDGVFDSFEVIATGLGGRGPQGLLVFGDRLYAVGSDGIQLYEGYRSGNLVHRGRLGAKMNTGGDHDAHTIFRGHDGYLYFMAGNGAGIEDRRHITETNSPVLFEREASVFRIDPDGKSWECIAAGGRNPPNLGMNYLGELFSFDSDMEWHVGLPFYRPGRLNHWAIGGDQGWQDVGAYPPYFIDCLPGILDIGRGSPTWGTFYEHTQFPAKYRDAYLACDYRWKRESDDQYATTGRLVAFFLQREGASWKASMEILAKPKPGARDADGRPINFALVDVTVAPDGSLFITDHNQGVWRIFYDPKSRLAATPPPIAPTRPVLPSTEKELSEELLTLPQPASEWTRLREEAIRAALGDKSETQLKEFALDSTVIVSTRLRALRLLAPGFQQLPVDFIATLAKDPAPELRGQAAWLLGLRKGETDVPELTTLLQDNHPFVRRRAAEALTRLGSSAATTALVDRLADPVRLVRYVAMTAVAHRPTHEWFEQAVAKPNPQIRLRALVASLIRREPPSTEAVHSTIRALLQDTGLAREDRLDFLRVLGLFQKSLQADAELKLQILHFIQREFPTADRDFRWEQVRLLGEFRGTQAFGGLLALLESESEHPAQFHIAQALAHLPSGWNATEQERLVRWFLDAQSGWFAEFTAKGVEFPMFWSTVLAEFAQHHRAALLRDLSPIDFAGQLGGVVIDLLADSPQPADKLLALYRENPKTEARLKIVNALKKVVQPKVSAFLRAECQRYSDPKVRGAFLVSLCSQPVEPESLPFVFEGLRHESADVVRACASSLLRYKPPLDETLAHVLLGRFLERRDLFHALEKALTALSGDTRPGFKADADPGRRPDDATRTAGLAFWKNWYEQRFQKQFAPAQGSTTTEKNDEEIHQFILSVGAKGGNGARGGKLYEALQCNSCHGGGVTPGREGQFFGPDLAGVTRRLTRQELADAMVYPSKQVADRFKAFEVTLKEGEPLIGFITEQSDAAVTLVDKQQVHRLVRKNIQTIAPQTSSLMPERLINRLTLDELRDLLTFLEEGGRATNP